VDADIGRSDICVGIPLIVERINSLCDVKKMASNFSIVQIVNSSTGHEAVEAATVQHIFEHVNVMLVCEVLLHADKTVAVLLLFLHLEEEA